MTALSDHKTIGKLFMALAAMGLVVGIALNLPVGPQAGSARGFQGLFSASGIILMFVFVLPTWLGIASAVGPLQVGARRVAFPRAHSFGFGLFAAGAAMVVAAPLVSDDVRTWNLGVAMPSGAEASGPGPDLLILGLILVAVAAVATMVNILTTLLQLRTPAMALRRMPMFAWSTVVSSSVMVLALPVLIATLVMLFIDSYYGGQTFGGDEGGNPLMGPRLFWFGVTPFAWSLVIASLGAMAEIVPVFARRALVSPARSAGALGALGVLAFAGWGAEVTSLGSARVLLALGALAALAPVASVVLNLLATIGGEASKESSQPRDLKAMPVLAVLGGLTVVGLALLAGAVAALNATGPSRAGYFGPATHHLLYFGIPTVASVAATHYWAPKLWGRHLNDSVGKLSLAALIGGLHVTFLPLLVLGFSEVTGGAAIEPGPLLGISNLGTYLLGLGAILFAVNLLTSAVAGWGRQAGVDPWGGHTLEWATTSPPPPHNFDLIPAIVSATPLLDPPAVAELEAANS